MTSFDFLIVGAGPVGLTLALECCRHQIDFRIIDHHLAHSDKSKALVVWSGTLECLAAMGVAEQFIEKGLPVRRFVLANHGKILNEISVNQKIDSPQKNKILSKIFVEIEKCWRTKKKRDGTRLSKKNS